MFSNKVEKSQEEISNSSSIVSVGTYMEGDIETHGNIRIEGSIKGNVRTKSKSAHGQSSYVEGNVLAQNAEVAGEVSGTVEVIDLLTLKPTAVVHGDIIANKIIIESGAQFNGTCRMGNGTKEVTLSHDQENTAKGQNEKPKDEQKQTSSFSGSEAKEEKMES